MSTNGGAVRGGILSTAGSAVETVVSIRPDRETAVSLFAAAVGAGGPVPVQPGDAVANPRVIGARSVAGA